ncbi:119f48d5-9b93-4916-a450-7b29d2b7de97 [Sclerotinia trifoliorum]|uniref:119f48d5-9b93-4916-a450-7b29d2b7de97 n=1 Tax=Sclerotinia trifoliorum TaxID=28548 RepID=A0A8H2VQE7_9HELO|nr:119f48d5-9b93-4916-a450-7b29d2b7de97 [Sclerotinia trifoliorum]
MFKSYILQAIFVSHIVAMAIPTVAVDAAIVRSVGDADADADELIVYDHRLWKKEEAASEVDADELIVYDHRVWKKDEADADEATVYPRPAW